MGRMQTLWELSPWFPGTPRDSALPDPKLTLGLCEGVGEAQAYIHASFGALTCLTP